MSGKILKQSIAADRQQTFNSKFDFFENKM